MNILLNRSDGYKNTINNNKPDTEINNNEPYIERFKGKSQEKEFLRVTLTVNGDIQQSQNMMEVCQAFCNRKGVLSMCQSIADMKIYYKTYFVKATINKSKYTTTDIVWGQSD